MVKLVSVGRARKPPKIDNFGLKVRPLGSQGAAHLRPRRASPWELEVRAAPHEVPGGQTKTKIFKLRWFLGPLTKTRFTTPHYYLKHEVQAIDFFVGQSLKLDLWGHV